jgi:hypothetical protein
MSLKSESRWYSIYFTMKSRAVTQLPVVGFIISNSSLKAISSNAFSGQTVGLFGSDDAGFLKDGVGPYLMTQCRLLTR